MEKENLALQELIEQGRVLYSVDNYTEALVYLKKAQDLDPYCEAVYENMCTCYIMMDQFEEARKVLNQYLLLNKNSGLAHFHLGNIALLEGKAAEAKACYSKAELLGFTNPVMYVNMASFYEETGDYDKALGQYNRLLAASPYDYAIMEKKTQMLLRAARFSEALKSAKTMVSTDIDAFEGHHYVYVSLITLERLDDAKRYIDDVVKRFPDNQTALFDRARLFDLSGDIDQALETLERDFADYSSLPHVALLRLGLLLQKDRTDEVIPLIEQTPSLRQDANALTILYSIYYSKGNYAKALEYCDELQNLGEESSQFYATWYFRPLVKRRMGQEEEAKKEFAEASGKLRRIIVEQSEHIDLNMYRALCEYQLGNYKEAQKNIEYLLAVQPNAAVFHLAAAIVYEALGLNEEAENHRAVAKELDPGMISPVV